MTQKIIRICPPLFPFFLPSLLLFLLSPPLSLCDWCGMHGNPTNSGWGQERGPEVCFTMKSSLVELGGNVSRPGIVLTNDHRVVVSSNDSSLISLSIDTEKQFWTFQTQNQTKITSNLVCDIESYTYFGDERGMLYKLSPNGKLEWLTQFFHPPRSLQISHSGELLAVAFPELDGGLDLIDTRSGETLWSGLNGTETLSSPAFSIDDSTLVITTFQGVFVLNVLYSSKGKGELEISERFVRNDLISLAPPVLSEISDLAYILTMQRQLVCFSITTSIDVWIYDGNSTSFSFFPPTTGGKTNPLVLLPHEKSILSFDPETGELLWEFEIDFRGDEFIIHSTSLDLNGNIWVPKSGAEAVIVLDKDGNEVGAMSRISCEECKFDPLPLTTIAISESAAFFLLQTNQTKLLKIPKSSCDTKYTSFPLVFLMILIIFVAMLICIIPLFHDGKWGLGWLIKDKEEEEGEGERDELEVLLEEDPDAYYERG